MKKTTKRIVCGALSALLAASTIAGEALRSNADGKTLTAASTSSAKFTDVTGQFDTTALREENFNSSVLENEQAPKYETRSVMVTLEGDNLVNRSKADGYSVQGYLQSFTGSRATAEIKKEQNDFLKRLSKTGIPYALENTYNTVLNAVAIEVDTQYVSRIKQMDGVKSVVITTEYSVPKAITTSSAENVTNQTSVYDTGIYDSGAYASYGAGSLVAILDTGLDYTHDAYQKTPSVVTWDEEAVEDIFADLEKQGITLNVTKRSGAAANDVFVSNKVPFAYDYADDDADVYPSYSNHGTHVAGIIGGYDENGYTDKDGEQINETFKGVVPDAQLVICKVFTDDLDDEDLGGAVAEDIIAALEDCVNIGVDVINMSLGTSCGFTTTDDGDDEGMMLNEVYDSIKAAGISLVCAASNDYSSAYGGTFGTNLTKYPDSGTVGSPSTFASALSVASISGQKSPYMIGKDNKGNDAYVFYEESRDMNGNANNFAEDMQSYLTNGEVEYVVIPGYGEGADYSSSTIQSLFKNKDGVSLNRVALVQRGNSTFKEKVELAMAAGAVGIIVYNNVAGVIRMNLGEIENPIPAVSIDMESGSTLVNAAKSHSSRRVGKLKISQDTKAGPFMSDFSSWGPTYDLKLKPEITAHGGEITSTVPGGYGEQSGTSMASPNMAGVMAIIRNYIKALALRTGGTADEQTIAQNVLALVKDANGNIDPVKLNRLANQLIMSTATMVKDQAGRTYSPRKQGAGLGSLENVVTKTQAFLSTDLESNLQAGDYTADGRPKLELGDDPEMKGEYTMSFNLTNFGVSELVFTTNHLVLTETIAKSGLAVAEQSYTLSPDAVVWSVDGNEVGEDKAVRVAGGQSVSITVSIYLSNKDKTYLDKFENGMYVEGFLQLVSQNSAQCSLNIPFLGFYGDWYQAPMLDYTAFEVAESDKTESKEEDKIKASIWATLPYNTYYNEKYIVPMGSYVYLLDDNDDKMYANEAYCSVSRYNEFYGEDSTMNYMTSTAIKAVYAGLLRNAKYVRYKMYNEQTGELVYTGECNRVGKAYTGGSASGIPANVEIKLSPEAQNLAANGRYTLKFEFFACAEGKDAEGNYIYPESAPEENTYEFTFTVDYEAPILQDARVRYENYKVDNVEKQRIYLDVDVYDNHYAQSVMLCYPKKRFNFELGKDETVLQLATEYPTPVRQPNKNGTTTVSIEVTDIYEKYGSQLYVQLDDYAINSCLYQIDISKANDNMLPGSFELAEGESNITLGVYQTHKVALEYAGNANLSNFHFSSSDSSVALVKNGEIVGMKAGRAVITVLSADGNTRREINVTVTQEGAVALPSFSISYGVIKTADEALTKAQGTVEVKANKKYTLDIVKDPWYYPTDGMTVVWSTDNPAVATLNKTSTSIAGNVEISTLKKGSATITARIYKDGVQMPYSTLVRLRVINEFDAENYTLYSYNGVPENGLLVIPEDLNVMTIAEQAFKDNDTIKKIVIPSTVTEIQKRAFENCSALEEVYFVSQQHRVKANGDIDKTIDWADLSMVYERAFYNCTNLKKIDLSNVKTITVGKECFYNCTSLSQIIDQEGEPTSIGTMHHSAFKNCTSLVSINLTGLHMAGDNVFEGCTALESIQTGKFTAIGKNMFKGCENLYEPITIKTTKIGEGAFENCIWLQGVTLDNSGDATMKFDIGARAFAGCGTALTQGFSINFNGVAIRSIGKNAFKGTKVTKMIINDTTDVSALRFGGMAFDGVEVEVQSGSTKFQATGGAIYALNANGVAEKLLLLGSVSGTQFIVPDTVKEIGSYAFANVRGLKKVVLGTSVSKIGEGAFEGSSVQELDCSAATALTEIAPRAFYGSAIGGVSLPASVIKLGDYAFANSAVSAFTASGLQEIGSHVFMNCDNLTQITLASSIARMGDGTFMNCAALKTAMLPAVKSLGMGTFIGSGIENAIFADGATTTGEHTFYGTGLKSVTLVSTQTVIGACAFMGCDKLETVYLPTTVQRIELQAFADARKLSVVGGLDRAEYIGDGAFMNTALASITLNKAKYIGYAAFYAERSKLQTVDMPVVETIGSYAFRNAKMATLPLPATLKTLGAGAFDNAQNLSGVTFPGGNDSFMAEDNVVYRYLNEDKTEYELVFYAAYRTATRDQSGEKSYRVKDGTLSILANAFSNLYKAESSSQYGLDKVILPYTLNTIGDSAFYNSGIQSFVFESVQAPILESSFKKYVADMVESNANVDQSSYYKGLYYTNFENELLDYTQYGNKQSSLTIYYPANGVGYDNYIYGSYFGVKTVTAIAKTDATRGLIAAIAALKSPDEVRAWKQQSASNAAAKQEVIAFASQVQAARMAYNNVAVDANQIAFLSAEEVQKLADVELAVREVKKHFNIPVNISYLRVDETSAHRSEYEVGEIFDMTGLVVRIIYEDGSTEIADASKLTLVTDKPLNPQEYIVARVQYKDGNVTKTCSINITYKEQTSAGEQGGDNTALVVCLIVVGVLLAGGAAAFVLIKFGKKKSQAVAENEQAEAQEQAQSNEDTNDSANE